MIAEVRNYYAGTSGLLLPVPNKTFYPLAFQDKSRLCYYASLMNSIEINSSFYKIPSPATVRKWSLDVPEDFKFTFKLFKGITHNKGLAFDRELISRFFEAINSVGTKSACVLVQLPPSVRIEQYKQLDFLMSCLRENDFENQWKIAIEFRHSSLYIDEVYELLENYRLGMVFHDKSTAISPVRESEGKFIYLRFHGPNGDYKESYSDDILQEYAEYIRDWLADRKQVFVYFNNTMGDAYRNLTTLKDLVLKG